uniref:glycosyltransferase n=1 Tax=Stella sp. TaxID=2912054 RepID=UPI0035AEC348
VSLSGQYNLGFIGLRAGPEARRLVAWWRDRIAWNCIEDAANGTFVDQKVVDHFPALSDAVHLIRHSGYNVAYWNVHERPVDQRAGTWTAAGQPLVFFHYSGFEMFGAGISRHVALPQARGGAVDTLLRDYGRRLLARGDLAHAVRPYDYDRLPDGTRLSAALRRALHRALEQGAAGPGDLLRPGWLVEPVPATRDLPYGGTIPRVLQFLRRFGDLPAEAIAAFERFLDADAEGRRRALMPLLAALHAVGAVDVGTAERLIDRTPVPPPADGRPVDLVWPVARTVEDAPAALTIPALPLLLHAARADLTDSFDLADGAGIAAYLAWFLSIGLAGWTADPDTVAAIAVALDAEPFAGSATEEPASLLDAALARLLAPDSDAMRGRPAAARALAALLEGSRPAGLRPALAQVVRTWLWHRRDGTLPRILRLLSGSPRLRERLLGRTAGRRASMEAIAAAFDRAGLPGLGRANAPARPAAAPPAPPEAGTVVVGPFATTSGVGHSAHGVVAALAAAGLRPETVDLLGSAAVADGVAPSLLVLHANADVTLDAVVKFEPLWRRARRRVGYWYWELPAMTRRMAAPAMLLDEIWVASEFVRRAVAPVVGCPVRVCPPILRPSDFAPSADGGGSFGAGRRGFRFLGVVDARSFVARKNPEGIVRAFRHAFPDGDEPVELVVKLSNAHQNNADLARFRELAGGDRRIRLLEGTFSSVEMNDLYESADCFVSLHRSEGLGLGIAQAMMLGRAVVATGYSGPMDFMSAATAFLVPYRLVPVARDAYPDWLGQEWAEPDERAAAVYMKELARSPAAGRAVGARAAEAVRRHFAGDRVVRLMSRPEPPRAGAAAE